MGTGHTASGCDPLFGDTVAAFGLHTQSPTPYFPIWGSRCSGLYRENSSANSDTVPYIWVQGSRFKVPDVVDVYK